MRQIASIFLLLTTGLTLASCQTTPISEPDEADRAGAEAKLQQFLAEKEKKAQQEEKQRQLAAQQEAARLAESQRPKYAPARLAAAAKPRNWAHITVPDLNVDCVLNSTWTNGQLNYRVALLGQRPAIDTFLSRYRSYAVNFADQSGMKIFEFQLPVQDFTWAPPGFNGGIPTMELRGAEPVELPVYEQSVQWNLTWGL